MKLRIKFKESAVEKILGLIILLLIIIRIFHLNIGWDNHSFFSKDDIAPHVHTISTLLDGYEEWDSQWNTGYNRFEYYSNIYYMTAAVLANIFGLFLGYKVMYAINQVFLPLAFYFMFKNFGLKKKHALLATAFLLLTEQSTFYLQNALRVFSYPFIYLALGFTAKFLKKPGKKKRDTTVNHTGLNFFGALSARPSRNITMLHLVFNAYC
ncbi:MAG: hypothetical protein GOU97_01115 [Nanoarchaeota archaeon]|nr:hypothetical protein [Nanoarchaeota archaeon]